MTDRSRLTTPVTQSVRAAAPTIVEALQGAALAAARSEPRRSSGQIEQLAAMPFDLVAVAASVLIARKLSAAPAALLLSVQAEAAPAATSLTRVAGQLFLLSGELLARREAADAPLVALQAMCPETGAQPLIAGAVWALALLERLSRAQPEPSVS